MSKLAAIAILMNLLCYHPLSKGNMLRQSPPLTAVEGIPFSALIYFEDHNDWEYDIRLIMAPEQVTEQNIRLLGKILSRKYPPPKPLAVHVTTDLESPCQAARGVGGAFDPGENEPKNRQKEKKEIEVRQWAFYTRRADVELFRYNPNYPKDNGMKTVILRGKE